MSAKTIVKVQWLNKPESLQPSINADPDPDECLSLALRAEALDQSEWAEYWLDQAVVEERQIQRQLEMRA